MWDDNGLGWRFSMTPCAIGTWSCNPTPKARRADTAGQPRSSAESGSARGCSTLKDIPLIGPPNIPMPAALVIAVKGGFIRDGPDPADWRTGRVMDRLGG